MYRSVFKLPLIQTKDILVVKSISVQIITAGAGYIFRCQMHAGAKRSPWKIQESIRPSKYYTQTRDSSEKKTLCHFLYPSLLFGAPESLLLLCYNVKESQSNVRCTGSIRWCKHRRTVRMDFGRAANLFIFWLMIRYEVMQFCKGDFILCLYS